MLFEMAESKFLKAKCRKTGLYYGLEIQKVGLKWKVVNMIRLSDDEARVISSEVKAKYLFSIHFNSNTSSRVSGLETYTPVNINYDFIKDALNVLGKKIGTQGIKIEMSKKDIELDVYIIVNYAGREIFSATFVNAYLVFLARIGNIKSVVVN